MISEDGSKLISKKLNESDNNLPDRRNHKTWVQSHMKV